MKRIILPSLIIILSAVVFSACKKQPQQESPTVKVEEKAAGFSGTIRDLMGMKKAQKCTWIVEDQGSSVVYVDGDNTRIESSVMGMNDQAVQQMITISDQKLAHTWNPVTKQGMKMNVEDTEVEEMEDESDEEAADYEVTVNENFEFKCESWKADKSMFEIPTDVNFTDMNAMVEQMEQNVDEMKKVCDFLSGEDKEECLKGFSE